MLNQSLLANRRCVTHLMLTLQEENALQESLLHLHWEACLSSWRTSKVNQIVDRFRWVKYQDRHSNYRQVQTRYRQVQTRYRQFQTGYRRVQTRYRQVQDQQYLCCRLLICSAEDPQLVSGQHEILERRQTLEDQRCDIISKIR